MTMERLWFKGYLSIERKYAQVSSPTRCSKPNQMANPEINQKSFWKKKVPKSRMSHEPVMCLEAMSMRYHREGPDYISPSSGWTNPTLDPRSSTNTFLVPNYTFIVTLSRSDV